MFIIQIKGFSVIISNSHTFHIDGIHPYFFLSRLTTPYPTLKVLLNFFKKIINRGWINDLVAEHLLLLQRTRVWFLTCTW